MQDDSTLCHHGSAGDAETPREIVDGRYRVVAPLGQGGFGRVDLVEDALDGEALQALKRLRPELLSTPSAARRFREEIHALRALAHDGIPRIHNDGRTCAGELYFTMEYVEGPTLEETLVSGRRLETAHACRIALAILEVLDYAHRKGFVHRDLKPSNVILGRREKDLRVVVLDFGIAKLIEHETALTTPLALDVTQPGLGTPQYMSPEQILGRGVDARADLFALGVLLYRMLSGRVPWLGTALRDAVLAGSALETAPLRSPGISGELDGLVQALLSFEREQRPTLEVARERLQRALSRRRPSSRTASLLVGACASFGTIWALTWRGAEEQERIVENGGEEEPCPQTPSASQGNDGPDQSPHVPRIPPVADPGPEGESVADTARTTEPLSSPSESVSFRVELLPQGMTAHDFTPDGWPARIEHPAKRIQLVRLPIGTAVVGALDFDPRRERDEPSAEDFSVSRPIYLASREVTWEQYRAFCDDTGRSLPHLPVWNPADDHPVVGVSWEEALAFASWCGLELPSAGMLEYAARCGQRTVYAWGNAPRVDRAPEENLADASFTQKRKPLALDAFQWDDGFPWTAPVGAFGANVWGFCDLVGNAAEWCVDADTSAHDPPDGERHSSLNQRRVVYGSGWSSGPQSARLSAHGSQPQSGAQAYLGFRVAWKVLGP